MSRNRKNRATDPVVAENEAKTVETTTEVTVEPGTETAPPAEASPAPAEPVVEVPAPVYALIATEDDLAKRNIRKGFETVLIAELKNGPGTCQQLVDRMLASGEFARVAPRAAELRPTKPTQFLLTKWAGADVVAIASAEEAAAHQAGIELAAADEDTNVVPEDLNELSGEGSTIEAEATDSVAV